VNRPRDPRGARRPSQGPDSKGKVLQAHPLTIAIAGGFAAITFLMSLDQASRDTLVIEAVMDESRLPKIDGDVSDPIWREAKPVWFRTQQGANLDGQGGSMVEIRAVHDNTDVYFSFIWEDPTRSLKHVPLVKTKAGWRVLQDGFDHEDATAFFEDKLAILFAPAYVLIPGDRTFHAGRSPLDERPASKSNRGYHYTMDGSYVDIWQWRASNGGMLGWIEDSHFGPPATPTLSQLSGKQPYKGGFEPDPGKSTALNFDYQPPGGYSEPLIPYRLPKDYRKTMQAMGKIDLAPDHGESEGSTWWMTEADSVPYSKEADQQLPVGAIIPGVIVNVPFQGDRADIRCAAKWAAGRWSLEVVRKLDTKSKYDVPIKTGTYMRVAVFDHAQSRHTRAIRPIQLKVNKCENAAECLSTVRNSPQDEATSYSTQP
jgi:ethylbenzene dehydrogenase